MLRQSAAFLIVVQRVQFVRPLFFWAVAEIVDTTVCGKCRICNRIFCFLRRPGCNGSSTMV